MFNCDATVCCCCICGDFGGFEGALVVFAVVVCLRWCVSVGWLIGFTYGFVGCCLFGLLGVDLLYYTFW